MPPTLRNSHVTDKKPTQISDVNALRTEMANTVRASSIQAAFNARPHMRQSIGGSLKFSSPADQLLSVV